MRKFCFILTALFCAALFTSCTDDDKDDEGGNGQGGGNGGSGVVILPKKVKEIVVSYKSRYSSQEHIDRTTLYAYDAQERVSSITTTEPGNTTSRVKSFTYTDNKITIEEENNEPIIIELKDGRAVSSSEYEGEKYIIQGSYTYSGNYLSKLIKKVVNEDVNDGSMQNYLRDSSIFVVKDGNLDSVDYYYYYYDENEKQKGIMSYVINNERDNNVNLDLYGLLIGEDVILLNLTGTRYRKLPSLLTDRDELSDKTDVTHYSYKVEEGYITKITEAMEGEDEYFYTITYE